MSYLMKFPLAIRLLILLLVLVQVTEAQPVYPPQSKKLVNDYAGILSNEQEAALEEKLVALDDTTTNQIAVVIVESTEGEDINFYGAQLGEKWGIGGKKDNGVLLVIASSDRNVAIQVGYGLEPVITDLIAGEVIRGYIVPAFKHNNYYQGIDEATTILAKLASGEISDIRQRQEGSENPIPFWVPILIMLGIIILFSFFKNNNGGKGGKKRNSYDDFRRGTGPFFGPVIFPRSGGGGFGGGGGGFGGFGGGGFGGGGASGSW